VGGRSEVEVLALKAWSGGLPPATLRAGVTRLLELGLTPAEIVAYLRAARAHHEGSARSSDPAFERLGDVTQPFAVVCTGHRALPWIERYRRARQREPERVRDTEPAPPPAHVLELIERAKRAASTGRVDE
jgi:hypothetical protein